MVLKPDDDEVVERVAGVQVDSDVLVRTPETVLVIASVMIKLSLVVRFVSMAVIFLLIRSAAVLHNVITEVHKVLTRSLADILGRENEPFYLLFLNFA